MTKSKAKAAYDLRLKKRLLKQQKSQNLSTSHHAGSVEIEPSQDGSSGLLSKPSVSEIKVVTPSSGPGTTDTISNHLDQSIFAQSTSDRSSDASGWRWDGCLIIR